MTAAAAFVVTRHGSGVLWKYFIRKAAWFIRNPSEMTALAAYMVTRPGSGVLWKYVIRKAVWFIRKPSEMTALAAYMVTRHVVVLWKLRFRQRCLLESIYFYFPSSSQLVYLCFCPVGLSLL